MNHNKNIFKNELFLFSHSPLKDLQNDIRFVGIGQKITELHPFEFDKVSKVYSEKKS